MSPGPAAYVYAAGPVVEANERFRFDVCEASFVWSDFLFIELLCIREEIHRVFCSPAMCIVRSMHPPQCAFWFPFLTLQDKTGKLCSLELISHGIVFFSHNKTTSDGLSVNNDLSSLLLTVLFHR